MTRDKIDQLWQQAMDEAVKIRALNARYHFAALVLEEAARVCDEKAMRCEKKAEEAIENGEHDEVSVIRSTAWQIRTCAQAIRAMKPEVKT